MQIQNKDIEEALDVLKRAKQMKDDAAILEQAAKSILLPYYMRYGVTEFTDSSASVCATYVKASKRKSVNTDVFKNALLEEGVDAVTIHKCETKATSITPVKECIRVGAPKKGKGD